MSLPRTFLALLCLGTVSLHADDYFDAAQVCTLEGQATSPTRYGRAVYSEFVAGSRLEPYSYDTTRAVSAKGVAYFDLNQDGLRAALEDPQGARLYLSFILLKTVGEPGPLRVSYLGMQDDINSEASRARQFRSEPLQSVGRVLEPSSQPGLKIVDVTPLLKAPVNARWLVVRFEQDGYRPTNNGKSDLYQFNGNNSSVRLTLSTRDNAHQAVVAGYESGGLAGAIDLDNDGQPNLSSDPVPTLGQTNVKVRTIYLGGSQQGNPNGQPVTSGGVSSGVQGTVATEQPMLPDVHTQQVGTGNFDQSEDNLPGSSGTFTGDEQGEFGE
ncbi:hypothetical protein [Ruficoccus sp. ZRK36]|uniref:hypothetical protein n=1 Tax=Ruficoccus sp. ZRK36 TaxID=2866311 RepID=UPI001C72FE75|nr:hypothetical protein [Ruficoccus sp. ZRK36]QYY35708.1 hypothetical protein K0V07_15585 [Ruficoccus sp. ZRK36]